MKNMRKIAGLTPDQLAKLPESRLQSLLKSVRTKAYAYSVPAGKYIKRIRRVLSVKQQGGMAMG